MNEANDKEQFMRETDDSLFALNTAEGARLGPHSLLLCQTTR